MRERGLGQEAGRGPLPVTLQIDPREPALLERYERAGVNRAVYMIPPMDPGEVERRLDKIAATVAEYAGTAA